MSINDAVRAEDVRKALYLFTRTTGALLEWFHSAIHYLERETFAQRMRELATRANICSMTKYV